MAVPLAHRVDGPPSAPAVLLSPSLGTTWEMWDSLAATLATRYRVVRFDTRGHGRSPVPAGPYSVDDLAGDVLALADDLELSRFAFVGLSLGGAIGQTLAAGNPSRLTSVVLCCTLPKFGDPASWTDRAASVRASGMSVLAEATRGRWFTEDFRASHPDEVERLIAMLTSTDPEGYASCCEALSTFSSAAWLGSVAVPTRVIAGSEDPVAAPAACAEMASMIPGADLVVVRGTSHIANLAQPSLFANAVTEHLEGHP